MSYAKLNIFKTFNIFEELFFDLFADFGLIFGVFILLFVFLVTKTHFINTRYKIQDTRCIFRASEATLSGFSSEKGHKQVLLKSIKHMQVHIIQYRNAGDDEIESLGLL